MTRSRSDVFLGVLLAAGAIAAFVPVFTASFVDIDDHLYVVDNRYVRTGLSADNFARAWTSFSQANWHPLTWLSLQLDASLWRADGGELDARGFHAVNVLIHACNAALLYSALLALTGRRWPSALAAAFFAVHPLRVESVAWVSERKDVLSILFGLCALRAYAGYVNRPTAIRSLAVAGTFLLSVLSKPTLVTFPCLLLVLDWWPLGRLRSLADVRRLVVEKLPVTVIALASCAVTFVAQRSGGAVSDLEMLPFTRRIATALVAYATYLQLTVWPLHLAPIYPYPANGWPSARVAVSAALVVGLSALAVWQRRRRPYLLAGWLWYVGTLVPVLGIVQIGGQPYADRYSYFPSIGLYLVGAWAAAEAAASAPPRQRLLTASAAILLVSCATLTWNQARHWTDDLTLWRHTLEVTGPNAFAYNCLGTALERRDKDMREASGYYRLAAETDPDFGNGQYNLARSLHAQGQWSAAADHYRKALRSNPHLAAAHNDLGALLNERGSFGEAEMQFREALSLDPDNVPAHRNLAWLLDRLERSDEALAHSAAAVQLAPDDGRAQFELGLGLYRRKAYAEAVAPLRRALELQADAAAATTYLAIALQRLGHWREAIACLRHAVELEPEDLHSRLRLATALASAGDAAGSQDQFQAASRLDTRWPEVLAREAWKYATAADAYERDGNVAVWSAETACSVIDPVPAAYLDILAAAYAEVGRFADAASTAEKAVRAATAVNKTDLAAEMADRLALYRRHLAFHRKCSVK